MRGKLVTWNDDAGYGFIKHSAVEPHAFVHIVAFEGLAASQRPKHGDTIEFEMQVDRRTGKDRAAHAVIVS